jgi:acetyl esterase/lipase
MVVLEGASMKKLFGRLFVLGLALVVTCSFFAGCGTPRTELIPQAEFFNSGGGWEIQITPNGEYMCVLASDEMGRNIFVTGPNLERKVRQRTDGVIHDFMTPTTNNHIIYEQDFGGNEKTRVYSFDITTRKTIDLTPFKDVKASFEGSSMLEPETILLSMNNRDQKYFDFYKANILTGKLELVYKNEGFTHVIFNDKYQPVSAHKETDDGGREIFLYEKGKFTLFQKIGSEDSQHTRIFGYNEKEDKIMMMDSVGRDIPALVHLDPITKKKEIIAQSDKGEFDGWCRNPYKEELYAVKFNYDKPKWVILDEAYKSDFVYLDNQLMGDFDIRDISEDGMLWVVKFQGDLETFRYGMYDRNKKQIAFIPPGIPPLKDKLSKMHPKLIKARDGLELVCYLTVPMWLDDGTGKTPHPIPLIVDVHGGPWARDDWGFNSTHQLFANRGYAVLSVNFRGSAGFGKSFRNAGNGQWGNKMHQDVMDAVDWVVAQGIADPDKMAIMGGSYGGFEVLTTLYKEPGKFKCAIETVGISDLKVFYDAVPSYWKTEKQNWIKAIGANPDTTEGLEHFKKLSPVTHADKMVTPLLIAHGKNDSRVSYENAKIISDALTKKGVPVTLCSFPDEGHGLYNIYNYRTFYLAVQHFLAKWLGGEAEPYSKELQFSSMVVENGIEHVPGLADAIKK